LICNKDIKLGICGEQNHFGVSHLLWVL